MSRLLRFVAPTASRSLLLAAAFALALGATPRRFLFAEADSAPGKETPKPKLTFAPEAEEKLAKFLQKVTEAKRKILTIRINKQLAEVTKTTGLDAEAAKSLEPFAKQAVEQSMAEWAPKFDERFRDQYKQMIPQSIEQMTAQAEAYAGVGFVEHEPPEEESAWLEGLKKSLAPEQAAVWEKAQTERRQIVDKEISDFLKPITENMRDGFATALLAKSSALKVALSLPKETASKLDDFAKSAADQSIELWRKRATKALLNLEETSRKKTIKNGEFYQGSNEQDTEAMRAVWAKDIAAALSPEDAKRWQEMQENRRAKHVQAMSRILMTAMDRKVALTSSQRAKLGVLAERLVRDDPRLVPAELDEDNNNYDNTPLQPFYAAAGKAADAELAAILDDLQQSHWKEIGAPKAKKSDAAASGALAAATSTKATEMTAAEPEDVERLVSDFLFEKAKREHQRLLEEMTLKAEDATRVAGLPIDTARRLHTAALGAVESSMAAWKSSAEQTVRSSLGEAPPQTIKLRLNNLESENFAYRFSSAQPELSLWNKTVETEMTKVQQAAWKKEVDERQSYLDESVVGALLAGFDSLTGLTAEQWAKLEPIVAKIVKDYSADIAGYFGNYNSGEAVPWYMQYYYKFVPIAGIPENDLKEILSKAQWERWTGTNQFSNCTNYWTNLQRNHEQRVKEKK